jgi:RNA polymerase sigma-54 factor
MQKLNLHQNLQQKLSPQQIQFIKLLQIPTVELKARIQEALEENPALEEGKEDIFEQNENTIDDAENYQDKYDDYDEYDEEDDVDENYKEEININDYLQAEEDSYKTQMSYSGGDEEERETPISVKITFFEALESQLGFLRLNERERLIGKQIIGSLENDGYLRREIPAIVNDLAFTQNIETTEAEVLRILSKIQKFDPPGVAARNLQECLLIQLKRKKEEEFHTDEEKIQIDWAIEIIENHFEEFTKKHYTKIEKKLGIDEETLKHIIRIITKLNPKPGETGEGESSQYITPDFIVTNNNGKLELTLNAKNAPELRISRSFAEMLDTYQKSNRNDKAIKETVTFVKQKLDAAKWFIDAIKQRQQTLLKTMQAIVEFQYEFFSEGDESKLKPMILKDVAEKIGMDISTVSRVANSKYVQTEFGVFPLKYFFSEGIATETGEDASSREVKAKLKEFVDKENKKKPLSDDKLEKMLNDAGYRIARRTVAKYREQLGIPVARLRKEI